MLLYGRKFSTRKMGKQVPQRIQSEESKKDHLQPITSGNTAVYPGFVQMEGLEILEGHMTPDHVHLPLSIPPKYGVSSFMWYLKEKQQ